MPSELRTSHFLDGLGSPTAEAFWGNPPGSSGTQDKVKKAASCETTQGLTTLGRQDPDLLWMSRHSS